MADEAAAERNPEAAYDIREPIGKGAFGDVYLAVHKDTKAKWGPGGGEGGGRKLEQAVWEGQLQHKHRGAGLPPGQGVPDGITPPMHAPCHSGMYSSGSGSPGRTTGSGRRPSRKSTL